MFETEESGTRRYMGTITGISDLDPVRWKNSKWRNLQVGWDESAAGERRNRVSMWEIEPVQAPFFICPPPFFRSKRPRQPGMPDDESVDMENFFKRAMPWLGDEICIKDSSSQNAVIPGLSLLQWMNMQNPSSANSVLQSDCLHTLTGPVVQNYNPTDISRQLDLQAQILQQNNIQFNAQKPLQQTQQVGQLSKLSVPSDQPAAFAITQHRLQEINQHQRQQLLVSQSLPLNQIQNNLIQPQTLIQKQVQMQQQIQSHLSPPSCIVLNQPQPQQQQQQTQQQQMQHEQHQLPLQQQQQLLQQQQQLQQNRMAGQFTPQANQHMQLPEHQINLLLLQRLQQQQQSLLAQPMIQQPQQVPEQQKMLLEATQHLPNAHSVSQQDITPQQRAKNISGNMRFSQSLQHQPQQKLQQPQIIPTEISDPTLPQPSTNMLSAGGSLLNSAGTQSALTEEVPSCSTSPSTNNCSVLPQKVMNRVHGSIVATEVPQSAVTMLSPASYEVLVASKDVTNDWQKSGIKPSAPIPKLQTAPPQAYRDNKAQMNYLNAPSSATSHGLSQTDAQLQQSSFNQPVLFRDSSLENNALASDPRNNVVFGVNIDSQLGVTIASDPLLTSFSSGKEYQNHLASNNMVPNYSGSKEGQTELSSSIVSQSFGVPDMAFSSIDSTIDDSSLLNNCSWAPPQFQRMRTYTKVYKRGAVGRSIDITRYSGYDELKQDIARMFSIEGQLEDRQRLGWKLVYVDHEKDVLLVGDDPWEEFVSCVRSIKILSPQEVQQMSLDGDLGGNDVPPNQACSSSDCGNGWRGGCDQNSGNPSVGSYEHFD
uniref:Auxin-responsive protein n=1 Tax=Anthurium amnicola TaxID=1678845 RepID=A0A1D1XND5_9ARAE